MISWENLNLDTYLLELQNRLRLFIIYSLLSFFLPFMQASKGTHILEMNKTMNFVR